jgi:hypothetical protein
MMQRIFPTCGALVVMTVLLGSLATANERTASISAEELDGFNDYPAPVRQLLEQALALSRKDLKYIYGSADPAKGGMDCSGTIQHLLSVYGIPGVPRQANTIYRWLWKQSRFHAVNSPRLDSFEFEHLQPGDLLFWSGTYDIKRDPPVTHVMLYLGRLKSDRRPVMFGASEGRRYAGTSRNGVSVFDFVLPKPESPSRFLGYGRVPGLPLTLEKPASLLPQNPPDPIDAGTPSPDRPAAADLQPEPVIPRAEPVGPEPAASPSSPPTPDAPAAPAQ